MEETESSYVLLQSLNRFVDLISSPLPNSESDRPKSSEQLQILNTFLRANLLSQLRKLHPAVWNGDEAKQPSQSPHRDILIQWWLALLNFLSGDLLKPTFNTTLALDTNSICMECISRIMGFTAPKSSAVSRDRDIFSFHLLMTIRWITERLITNSKRRKCYADKVRDEVSVSNLRFIRNYNSLLHPLIGKTIAFSFCYLDDTLHYDYDVLKFLTKGKILMHEFTGKSLLPWRKIQFSVRSQNGKHIVTGFENASTLKNIEMRMRNETDMLDEVSLESKKLFLVMISYLQNSQVLTNFLCHYLFMVLNFHLENKQQKLDGSMFPGYTVILNYVFNMLKNDLENLSRFIKSQARQEKQEINITKSTDTEAIQHHSGICQEKILTFIFTKFQFIQYCECLRSLLGLFTNANSELSLLHDFFSQQEAQILKLSSKIPAYNSFMANIFFNNLLQFIIFQFESLPEFIILLDWDQWLRGIVGTIKTMHVTSQCVGIICLFNIWNNIPATNKSMLIDTIICQLWDMISIDCDFQITKILFNKLLLFRVLQDKSILERQVRAIKLKLTSIDREMRNLQKVHRDDIVPWIEEEALIFHNNSKFILEKQDPFYEDDALLLHRTHITNEGNYELSNKVIFSSMSRLANIRPSHVICRGKYPFDISDELVSRVAVKVAERNDTRRKEEARYQRQNVSSLSLDSDDSKKNVGKRKSKGITFAIGPVLGFTKGSHKETLEQTYHQKSALISSNSVNTVASLDPQEMFSLYSNVSSSASFGTARSESSDNIIYKISQQTRDTQIKETNERGKKLKLLAPPEIKYNSQISSRSPILNVFKASSLSSPIDIRKKVLSKVNDANKKWGVKPSSIYDKPLPNPTGVEVHTQIDTFSFESFVPTIEELQGLDLVADPSVDMIDEKPVKTNSLVIDFCLFQKAFPQITSTKTTSAIGKEYSSPECLSKIEKMRLLTRLTKLLGFANIFNSTLKELMECERKQPIEALFIDFDLFCFQSHSLNKNLAAFLSTT